MKSTYAVLLGIALLLVTPGLASADVPRSPVDRQQAINAVIARGLSQRGVPFTYGGGNTDGPTTSTDAAPAAPEANTSLLGLIPAPVAAPTPKVPGFDASGLMVYSYAAAGIKLPADLVTSTTLAGKSFLHRLFQVISSSTGPMAVRA